ncbi:DNA repair and recombination protein RadA [Vulcanisaeta sp. EB80]|jgi:DNA repair and recombination protein RadA|uniref:DNA repair and recombination protein RadA n=1 Tax=Vulcanisaeta sp. EB80 TaxID=1650660 RepID=UPI000748422F|nr:DNA repair and recombination protein RadA [Vulcanisaeta sp. EB80]KUO87319.1 MAG: DNA repair and recombination protein RadA [Vulcanisaeta sp. MG_3]MCG2864900.1 DNA repair and recombination protein RadA [Vulcanisaeta sp.]PLC67954.1 DNA repair and recombination protein RadA [Vulcanisaeta sp. EB80]
MPKGRRKVQEQEEELEEEREPEETEETEEQESGNSEQGTTVTATVSSGYPTIDVEEIEGVGRVTAQKLREAGYNTARDVAFASVKELAEILGSEDRAKQIIAAAQKLIGLTPFITAYELYEKRRGIRRISTGVKSLDELLGGGIETKAITEIVGEFGSGKTQLCHQLSVMVQLPEDKGGLNAKALYVDAENTFRPERIMQIAKYRGLDPQEALRNILYARAYNSDHQMMIIEESRKIIEKENIGLILIDSLVAHFRSEYPGRENLAERQQKLNHHIAQLLRIADIYNIAVVVTNQVIAQPDVFFGNPLKPAGGNVIAHGATYRIWLRKGKENVRIAKIFDSPYHPEREVTFRITEEGVVD